MSDEEKAAQEATAEESEVETKATEEQSEEADTEVVEADEDSAKYHEAELKREREARQKAEKALAEGRYKRSEHKRQEVVEEEVVEDEEDKPLSAKQFQTLMAKEREATRKELQNAEAIRHATELSGSDAEKERILDTFKYRSFPAELSLREQLEECYAIVNRKKLIGQRDEALRALKNRDGVSKDSSTTHHDSPAGQAPTLDAEMASLGYKWNKNAKRHEKKLGNGKLLIIDPKTKQTRMVQA